MYKYALLTGLGIGVGIGMIMIIGVCVKVCVGYNQIDIEENIGDTNGNESDSSDSDSDSSNDNNRGYIRYLENILDNSTEVTTNSFTLHHVDVDVSYNIINPEFVIVPPNPPNPPNSPNSQSNPTPSAPLEPSSNVITIENEDILGNIEYTYVDVDVEEC